MKREEPTPNHEGKGAQRLTLLLPALNEEAAIGEVLRSIPHDLLRSLVVDLRVLVVDGHSTDRTREIAESLGAEVIVQPGSGKGDAVRHGIRVGEGAMILVLDADGTYPTRDIPAFVRLLIEGADFVIGSRFMGGAPLAGMTRMNRFGNRLLSLWTTLLYATRITDVCSGMWGLTSTAVDQMRIESRGFDIEPELVSEACRLGLRIREIPIEYAPRKGESKLDNLYLIALRDALRILSVRLRRPGPT